MISIAEAEQWVRCFGDRKLLVVGDLMLDRYVAGSVERISPEAPVPVVNVKKEYSRPGGAANVALNVRTLGGQAIVAGVVGRDPEGEELLAVLRENGISTEAVQVCDGVRTTVKTRILAERQQVVRVDREDPPEALAGRLARHRASVAEWAGQVAGVIIEDYGKGSLTQEIVDAALGAAAAAGVPVGLDPKDNQALRFSGLALATPNYKEACGGAGVPYRPLAAAASDDPFLAELARRLMGAWSVRFLAITLGPLGMFLVDRGQPPIAIPARAREVFDVCGAGDTVIAATMLALAAGAPPYQAAALANVAAGVVVGKIGTAPCYAAELLDSLRE